MTYNLALAIMYTHRLEKTTHTHTHSRRKSVTSASAGRSTDWRKPPLSGRTDEKTGADEKEEGAWLGGESGTNGRNPARETLGRRGDEEVAAFLAKDHHT